MVCGNKPQLPLAYAQILQGEVAEKKHYFTELLTGKFVRTEIEELELHNLR